MKKTLKQISSLVPNDPNYQGVADKLNFDSFQGETITQPKRTKVSRIVIPTASVCTLAIVAAIVIPITLNNRLNNQTNNHIIAGMNPSSNSSDLTTFTTKELRNPESLSHSYSRDDTNEAGYVEFKNKMRIFSHKISEAFVKRGYASGENIVISPLSIQLCLGLAVRCANGQTRQEILDAFDMNYESFNQYYKLFYNENIFSFNTNTGDLMAEQLLTNSIWFDNDVSLLNDGLDALRDDYYCYSFETDFNQNNRQANHDITDFIDKNTNGILKPNLELSTSTLFALINTLYLKDIWNAAGSDLIEAPTTYKFKNSNGLTSQKQLLYGNYANGKVLNTNEYSTFYSDTQNGYRIYYLKANEGKNIKEIFNKETLSYVLDANNYVRVDEEKMEIYETRCIFPEYSIYSDTDLKNMFIEDFHIQSLFSLQSCDFKNIINGDVYCDTFKQIAKLDVDKKGIRGAAVTYMAYSGAAYNPYTQVKEDFVIDQEFGFVLTKMGNVLFSGIVTNIDK